MILRDIINAVEDEARLERSNIIVGSQESQSRKLLSLANRAGREILRAHDWTFLIKEHNFDTVQGQEEYDLPADFQRLIINTVWEKDQFWPVRGSLSPQEWQFIKNSAVGSGLVNRRYRIKRGVSEAKKKFVIDATPGADGISLVFEYVTKNWIVGDDGVTEKNSFTNDFDVSIFDPDLMISNILLRWQMASNLATTTAQEYGVMLRKLISNDRPAPVINLAGDKGGFRLLGLDNVPDTGYGG